jgi:hypothetical protein
MILPQLWNAGNRTVEVLISRPWSCSAHSKNGSFEELKKVVLPVHGAFVSAKRFIFVEPPAALGRTLVQ